MNTKTITMKITAAFAAVLMLFSAATSSVSAESTLIQIENANAFATSADIQIGENLTIDQRSHWAMIHTSQSMRAVYCLEPGKPVSNGDIYNADAENYLNSVTNPTLTAEEIRILLERVFQHALSGAAFFLAQRDEKSAFLKLQRKLQKDYKPYTDKAGFHAKSDNLRNISKAVMQDLRRTARTKEQTLHTAKLLYDLADCAVRCETEIALQTPVEAEEEMEEEPCLTQQI